MAESPTTESKLVPTTESKIVPTTESKSAVGQTAAPGIEAGESAGRTEASGAQHDSAESPAAGTGLGTEFGLLWSVKLSFQQYLSSLPDGRGYIGDGAVLARPEYGQLLFPAADPAEGIEDGGVETLTFRGNVTFTGHGGMLAVQVDTPVVRFAGVRAELTVTSPWQPDRRILLVTFTPVSLPAPAGVLRWDGTDVELAAQSTELFGDTYPAGTAFDPLAIVVAAR